MGACSWSLWVPARGRCYAGGVEVGRYGVSCLEFGVWGLEFVRVYLGWALRRVWVAMFSVKSFCVSVPDRFGRADLGCCGWKTSSVPCTLPGTRNPAPYTPSLKT